jgi:ABC-type uncharacterized transport system permease subunit
MIRGEMPSIRAMEVGSLILTSVVWGMLATALVTSLVLKKRSAWAWLLFAGLLSGATGSIIDTTSRVLHWPYRAAVIGSGVALALGAAGLAAVVVAAIRIAIQRQSRTSPAVPQPESPDES